MARAEEAGEPGREPGRRSGEAHDTSTFRQRGV